LLEVQALVAREQCRLLTITGPGGVGKSRLAKQALPQLAARFADGVYWIALDDLTGVVQAVARVGAELHVTAERDLLQAVCRHLRSRRLVLVLDNCEHLKGLAWMLERLLAEAPGLKICATSRARIGAKGEWLLPLGGLGLPAPDADEHQLLETDAVRLFVMAAGTVKPDFDATQHARDIGALVRAVGGMPLAILLAANWVRLLLVAEIVAELGRSLDVLESAEEEGEERPEHRSVRATFERSWHSLAPRERLAMGALSVFVGSFSREAARAVADASLPLLAALADKSMLQMIDGRRCTLHPLIRQFAAETLGADMRAAASKRHAEWFHHLLARLGPAVEAAAADACDEIQLELENCRLAWRWAVAQRTTALLATSALALMRVFELRGRAEEGLALMGEALPLAAVAPTPPAHAADLLSAVVQLQYRVGRLDDAASWARQGLKRAREAAADGARLRCLNVLGLCHWQWGRQREAKRIIEQSLRLARARTDARAVAVALGNLASVEKALGDYERARELMLEVLARQRELGDWVGVAVRLNGLAHLHQARGQWAQARAFLDEGLAVCVATPVNWKQGDDVIILASIPDAEAKPLFPRGWQTVKPYLRVVPQPR
jgi:predicted ATPase